MELKEIFDVIKNANTGSAVYTTYDKDVADAERAHILDVLKAKWPQEAAMLDSTLPKTGVTVGSSKF